MITLDRITSNKMAVAGGTLGLRKTAVFCPETLEKLLQRRRESFVSGSLRSPAGIATSFRYLKQCEYRDTWRLVLVRYVRMVTRCCELRIRPTKTVQVIFAQINGMELDVVLHMGANWMNV